MAQNPNSSSSSPSRGRPQGMSWHSWILVPTQLEDDDCNSQSSGSEHCSPASSHSSTPVNCENNSLFEVEVEVDSMPPPQYSASFSHRSQPRGLIFDRESESEMSDTSCDDDVPMNESAPSSFFRASLSPAAPSQYSSASPSSEDDSMPPGPPMMPPSLCLVRQSGYYRERPEHQYQNFRVPSGVTQVTPLHMLPIESQ